MLWNQQEALGLITELRRISSKLLVTISRHPFRFEPTLQATFSRSETLIANPETQLANRALLTVKGIGSR